MAATQDQAIAPSVERIRNELERQGRMIKWLASEIGYDAAYVGCVLNGRFPATRGFIALAEQALGIPSEKIA